MGSLRIPSSVTGILAGVIGCMIAGVVVGIIWLQIMKKFAETIIKTLLLMNIGMWIVVAAIGFMIPSGISLTIIGVIMALFYSLWTWCRWSRIPFASELLKIASIVTSRFQGTILISLAVIAFNIFWIFIWGCCAVAYLMVTYRQTCTTDDYGYEYCTTQEPSTPVIFLLLISFYWGFQVNKNVSHTTTCGVAATWYFSNVIDHKPTPAAFKRTMTTSFDSVCLGSLIVAFLQAVRAMLRSSKNGRSFLTLIALCLLGCIERLIRYFNKYAYAQCAIYGTSFVVSAKATWNLFMNRGILAIINDNLIGVAIGCGSLIGGVISAGVGFGIGYAFYSGSDDEEVYPMIPIVLACYGFLIGLVFCASVLMVLQSAVITLFVCYAEDPASMNANHPDEYNRLVAAKPEWRDVYRTYGGGSVNPVGPVLAIPVGQPIVGNQQEQSQTYAAAPIMNVQPQPVAGTEGGSTAYPQV